jgi:hypothetical protein
MSLKPGEAAPQMGSALNDATEFAKAFKKELFGGK